MSTTRYPCQQAAEAYADAAEAIFQAYDTDPIERAKIFALLAVAERLGQLAAAIEVLDLRPDAESDRLADELHGLRNDLSHRAGEGGIE
jgi:hypothetical protein